MVKQCISFFPTNVLIFCNAQLYTSHTATLVFTKNLFSCSATAYAAGISSRIVGNFDILLKVHNAMPFFAKENYAAMNTYVHSKD